MHGVIDSVLLLMIAWMSMVEEEKEKDGGRGFLCSCDGSVGDITGKEDVAKEKQEGIRDQEGIMDQEEEDKVKGMRCWRRKKWRRLRRRRRRC